MQSETTRAKSVTIERRYRARIEEVWDLWTTKEGFESWWGPQGFRVDVHELDARVGGALTYDMIANTAEMIALMRQMGEPTTHPTHARYTQLHPRERLVMTNVIDFLRGVEPYEVDIEVNFAVEGDMVRMAVTLNALHSPEFSQMQVEGFTSQLTKLDQRFG